MKKKFKHGDIIARYEFYGGYEIGRFSNYNDDDETVDMYLYFDMRTEHKHVWKRKDILSLKKMNRKINETR